MSDDAAGFEPVDPFDLPEPLGTAEVVWESLDCLRGTHLVRGTLRAAGVDDVVDCDLLAVDEAYPAPVAPTGLRQQAHQAWRHDQVHLISREGRLTIAVPASRFTAELTLEAVARLAKAVGANPTRYSVRLRLGG